MDSRFANLTKSQLQDIVMLRSEYRDRVSDYLLKQLHKGLNDHSFHPHRVIDEINYLEKGVQGITKAADQFKHEPLRGLWKKHFTQTSWMPRNLLNELKVDSKKSEKLEGIINETRKEFSDTQQFAAQIAHRVTIEAYENRVRKKEMDGEWIIFAKRENINYYLAVSHHTKTRDDDAKLYRSLIENCKDQFPFIFSS